MLSHLKKINKRTALSGYQGAVFRILLQSCQVAYLIPFSLLTLKYSVILLLTKEEFCPLHYSVHSSPLLSGFFGI